MSADPGIRFLRSISDHHRSGFTSTPPSAAIRAARNRAPTDHRRRVLEIGSGYNAALLCERLGSSVPTIPRHG